MPDYDEGWGRESSTEGISCAKCGRVYQPTNSCESCPFCRVVELEAIVETLPKCNRLDKWGKLVCDKPVILGRTRVYLFWYPTALDTLVSGMPYATTIGLSCDGRDDPYIRVAWEHDGRIYGDGQVRASECSDSREAAEAAKEGMPAG